MAWQLLSESAVVGAASEAWTLVPLPGSPGLVSYGFLVKVPADLPTNFGTAGFWCVAQTIASRLVYTRSHYLHIVGRGTTQGLRIIGLGDGDFIAEQDEALYLAYSLHRWIPRDVIQIWGLFS